MRTILLILVGLVAPPLAAADVTYPSRPHERTFILDEADMISDADEAVINDQCRALLDERQIPIKVVTITSLSDYGAGGVAIETYARNLFDTWGIGSADYNYGILLLVAEGDRLARIELGADWGREHDDASKKVMDRLIVTNFKKDQFSTGIVVGVDGLDAMARGEDIPGSPVSDALRQGQGLFREIVDGFGKACMFWLALPLVLVISLFRRPWGGYYGGWGGGGGFSGGGGGGGFSGGGGATGSW